MKQGTCETLYGFEDQMFRDSGFVPRGLFLTTGLRPLAPIPGFHIPNSRKLISSLTAFIFAFSMTIAPVSAEIVTVDGGTIDISADGTVTNWNVSGNPVWNVPEFNVAAGSTYNITGISDNSSLALREGKCD